MRKPPETTPKPIRVSTDWLQLEQFKSGCPIAKAMLEERAQIVCRECFGFGHSRSKCATRVHLNNVSFLSRAGKSIVGQYRSMVTARKTERSYTKWYALRVLKEWFALTDKAPDIVSVQSEIKALAAVVCFVCSGFGHKANDYQHNKRGDKIPKCQTAQYIDIAYKRCPDKEGYKEFKKQFLVDNPLGKRKRKVEVLGFKRQKKAEPELQQPAPMEDIADNFHDPDSDTVLDSWQDRFGYEQVKEVEANLATINRRYNRQLNEIHDNQAGYLLKYFLNASELVCIRLTNRQQEDNLQNNLALQYEAVWRLMSELSHDEQVYDSNDKMVGLGKLHLLQAQPALSRQTFSEMSVTKMLEDISLSENDKGQVMVIPVEELQSLLQLPAIGCDVPYQDIDRLLKHVYQLNKQEKSSSYRQITKTVFEHLTVVLRNGVSRKV